MEEYLLDANGEKTHQLVREMKYVIGSGTIARTYLTEENGWFYEMPVTWYAQARRALDLDQSNEMALQIMNAI